MKADRQIVYNAVVCNYCQRYVATRQVLEGDMVYVDWSVILFCKECEAHQRDGKFK